MTCRDHTFRASGITAYLENGGTLEKAAMIANHASTRTTQLYDRCSDEVSLDEVERILISPLLRCYKRAPSASQSGEHGSDNPSFGIGASNSEAFTCGASPCGP